MKVHFNSRDVAYRSPYGAVSPGTPVTFCIDVAEAPGAHVTLRTWTEEAGEKRFDMSPVEGGGDVPAVGEDKDSGAGGSPDAAAAAPEEGFVRYTATFVPKKAGKVWYHFVITDDQGEQRRFGAQDSRMGGKGRLVKREPPSFLLSVHDSGDYLPSWSWVIEDYLHGMDELDPEELLQTLRENYPLRDFPTALPWPPDENHSPKPFVRCKSGAVCPDPLPAAGTGAYFVAAGDVVGLWRRAEDGSALCMLMNASRVDGRDVLVPMPDEAVTELMEGHEVDVVARDEALRLDPEAPEAQRYAHVQLWPGGGVMLHFHPHERLQAPMEPGVGVLAHITSLPAGRKHKAAGTLGESACEFVDWAAEAGFAYWQVLPVSPTDAFDSPYAGISAFASNASLLEDVPDASPDALAASFPGEYRRFCECEGDWLEPYACFMAIRRLQGDGAAWWDWPKRYRRFDAALFAQDAELSELAERCRREQFAFEHQWGELRSYAHERGLKIVGDMPIYISADSAEVWATPDLFQLDSKGKPKAVAGCPPDAFAEEGQIWGNPLYDWDAIAADGYRWWLRRLQRAFDLYDYVRLDHFIGFSRYFSIPNGKKATVGSFFRGPGKELFRRAFDEFGPLPIVAEDLGLITPGVRWLASACGFPGMDIAQFAEGDDPLAYYAPRPEKVVYTGTHDNQTLLGYCKARYPHLGESGEEKAAREIMRKVATCSAPVVVFPLQDIIGLDDDARMNTPGVAKGNWSWKAQGADVKRASKRAAELVKLHRESFAEAGE